MLVRPVRSLVVTGGSSAESATYTAEIRSRYETDLSFQVGGKLVLRDVDVGATVKNGQLLAQLDQTDQQLGVDAARGAVPAAQSDLDRARSEEARYRDLLERGLTTRAQYQAQQTAVRSSEAKLSQATAELRLAQQRLGYTTLRATQDGVVTRVMVEVGSVVAAGQRAISVARPSELEAVFDVPDMRIGEVDTGGSRDHQSPERRKCRMGWARARDITQRRPGDPHLPGAHLDRESARDSAPGNDRECHTAAGGRRPRCAAARDDTVPEGRQARGLDHQGRWQRRAARGGGRALSTPRTCTSPKAFAPANGWSLRACTAWRPATRSNYSPRSHRERRRRARTRAVGFQSFRLGADPQAAHRLLMVVALFAGLRAYKDLGRDEDPPFTIKTMMVRACGRAPMPCRPPSSSPTGWKNRSSRSSSSTSSPATPSPAKPRSW